MFKYRAKNLKGEWVKEVRMGDQITLEDWLNEEIEVCDKCLRACCWHGLFMCANPKNRN
jgi:epoxyqueuosine reductase QueG